MGDTDTPLIELEEGLSPESPSKDKPLTARGARTRAALVAAARVIFERDGYLDCRLTDITAQARCSTGTFYTYFSSKEEVFAAVLEASQNDMLHPGMPRLDPGQSSHVEVIEASHRAYFEAYRRNAKLMMLLEQVAMIDPKFREMRRQRGKVFGERNARAIADLQQRGLADPNLDPYMASMALNGMVGRLAYHNFALGDDMEFEALVDTATKLWVNALKIVATPS
ncbi:TetR/AcrR family transcriptional regulator [Aeromicrobium chenweiae]|uniref:TetR family transcriptional regulator n=1 Tax=Aeromicrobium chenweiae TaxID=2079793 RepID=A0A2S0WHX6_9ACTN|nr:TetR/AcrR family transcriptional regulator [Aeromicrobium chenweiae]AWB90941.1 TetR family transcriptional regulator [Aeromicrobium chenweiae]TGN32161.1 TetR/AcrR family transcriptional regulator [Aeromicrobium chenweiae]